VQLIQRPKIIYDPSIPFFTDYVPSSEMRVRTMMHRELERIWEEMAGAFFYVGLLSQHLPEGTRNTTSSVSTACTPVET
jgi:hypothetical protein